MTGRRPRLVGLVVATYAAILRRYPRGFQDRCAEPMLETFERQASAARARGAGAFFRMVSAEYVDAIRSIRHSRRDEQSLPPLPHGRRGADSLAAVLLQDFRYAIRRLVKQPALVLFTVLTLGFAIAANAAIFSVVDAVLLRPSPFMEAERLWNLMNRSPRGHTFPGMMPSKLRQWRSETSIFEAVEVYRQGTVVVTGGAEPQEVRAAEVSPGLLATLGVHPRLGRAFTPDEAVEGANDVVVLSESFWRAWFGADPAAVGRSIAVNGRMHRVVGVMPGRFNFPTLREQLWLPLDADTARGAAPMYTLVRLADGLTRETANARIETAVQRLDAERPLPSGWGIALRQGPLTGVGDSTRRTVLVLFGAVALVLLTACANVANLLLSRAMDRSREFAIRLVLGASRVRLVRELLVEGLILGLAAGAAGLLAAHWAVESLVKLAPAALMSATSTDIAVDGRVLLFGFALAVITGVACNLPPAFRSVRAQGNEALAGRNRAAAATPFQRRVRSGLVVLEIALAVVLLVGAALMVRSIVKLHAVDIGYDPDALLAVTIGLDTERYGTEAARASFLRQLAADVEQLPRVSGVALASGLPPDPGTRGLALLSSERGPCSADHLSVTSTLVSPAYFGLMGIRVIDGRPLREDDPPEAAVISRSLASLCGSESLVGQRIRLDQGAPPLLVVGIAADVKASGLTSDDADRSVYLSFDSDPAVLPMTAMMLPRRVEPRRLIVRSADAAALIPEVKRVLWARDPAQPVLHAAPAADLMAESIRTERFTLALMILFSGVALALAAAGVFGVLAYIVAQRTGEIGIRMALGASASDIRRLVVGQGVLLAVLGTAAGSAAAWAFSRVLAGLLYEVEPRDPAAFVVTSLVVLMMALLASWIPTTRALSVDPASALRVE